MCSFKRLFIVLVMHLLLQSTVTCEEPDNKPIRDFMVPGGGTLRYSWREINKQTEIFSILYSGSPNWVVEQKHPRSQWHNISTLEEIELHMAEDITREEMEYITSLKMVSSLKVSETSIRRGAMSPLERMTWIKSLTLDFSSHLSRLQSSTHDLTLYERPQGEFFNFLDKLTSLETLVLTPQCDEETYLRTCKIKNLKWLRLGQLDKLEVKNAAMISNLSNLEYLSFQRLKDPKPILNGLHKHPKLTELWIDDVTLDTKDVELIASIRQIKKLHVRGGQIGSLSSLGANANLTMLRLYFTEFEASDGCNFLKHLPNLDELVLSGISRDCFLLENLRGHKKLKMLGVGAVLSENDITILESMTELESLSVGNSANSEWCKIAKRRLPKVTIHGVRD